MAMYLQFFDPFINMWPNLVPDGFIYLRAEPSTCFRRMNVRNRAEEGSVPMEYLESLHDKHENWLGKDVNKAPQLIVPGHPDSSQVLKRTSDLIVPGQPGAELSPQPMTPAMSDAIMEAPEVIRDDVVFLGSSAHRAIQRVPALVLDVNEDIDLNNDVLAKDAYATKVGTFFEYLQGIKKNEHKLVQTDKQLQALDSIEELSHSLPRSLRAELRSLVSEQRDSVAAARESGILL